MIDILLNPPDISNYEDYFRTLLSITGVLLGLAFTGLIFVLQSGLSSFKYSRNMFLEQYALLGGHLLVVLSYLTLFPLLIIYFGTQFRLVTFGYYLFCLIFTKSYLDVQKQKGYIHTLFSKAFVPRNFRGPRRYFRYITNLGLGHTIGVITYISITLIYPIIITYYQTGFIELTTKGFFYSTLILLTYCVIRIAYFIPEFFYMSVKELENVKPSSEMPSTDIGVQIDYTKERELLEKYLIDHGAKEMGLGEEVPFLDGTISFNLLKNRTEPDAWINLLIKVQNANVFEIRKEMEQYAYKLFQLLHRSQVDINAFVLSFHIQIGKEYKTKNIFLRTDRIELDKIFAKPVNPSMLIRQLETKLFDELFRDLEQDE